VPSVDDQVEIIGRLLLAGVLGAFIGLERELRGYPAGIRTIALVALGACLFTDISQQVGEGDRIAAQIVTGIGFIGAGVIFREPGGVKGITTAATIWAAAATGMAVGVELYIVAVAAAATVFILLWARPFTHYLEEALKDPESRLRRAATPDNESDESQGRRDD
jgi:putative Mg2+ transporter-C (MgtC) family protein